MRTIGEILSAKRKELNLSLGQAEKETKIRSKYLEAIEKNDFTRINSSITVKGFIRNYAQYLGLPPESALAVFRRDFLENEKGQIVPRGMIEPLSENKFSWTPKITAIAFFSLIFLLLVFFLGSQLLKFSAAPFIELASPQEGETYREKIPVVGKTDKDASLKIDGVLVNIDENGNFKEEVVLPKGPNILTIESSNREGKKRYLRRKIVVE